MSGWTRLKLVLSVLYWLGAGVMSLAVYSAVHEQTYESLFLVTQNKYSTPPTLTGPVVPGRLYTDDEIFGRGPPKSATDADFAEANRLSLPAIPWTLAAAAVPYAICAALWWAFAGFKRA